LARIIWLANLLFALVLCLALWFSYRQHIRLAQERTENTTLTLERSLTGMLDQIDMMLISVADELETSSSHGRNDQKTVRDLIGRLVRHVQGVNVVGYSDATGQIAANIGYPAGLPATTMQDRDYFLWLRDHPNDGTVSSKPIIGRVSGKLGIVFAHPYRNLDGSLGGAVFASIDLSRFSDMFGALKLGNRSRVAMIDKDYLRIAAHPVPSDPSVLGQRMQHEEIIQKLQTGITTLTIEFVTKLDNVRRIYAFRKLERRPYWIMTALSVEDELASWWRQVWVALTIMTIFVALTGTVGRQLQRSWRRQEETLSTLESTLEATDNGILVVGENGKTLHLNHRFLQMWGIPEDLAVRGDANAMLDLLKDQLSDPKGFIHDVEALHAKLTVENGEVLEFKDGRIFERASLPMILNGRQSGRVWRFRDVTERRLAENALQQSEELFRSYFNMPVIGSAITSLSKGWIAVNPKLCEILGYPQEELINLTWVEITHPEDIAKDMAEFERLLHKEKDGYSLEKRFIRKDGSIVHAMIAAQCIRKADGEIDHFVALVQDITDRKRFEDELTKKNEALERSNAELESYAYVASHDLREPLRNITTFTAMLGRSLEGRLENDDREFLKIITDAAKRMNSLVLDLLEVSRVGRSEQAMRPVALYEVITKAQDSLKAHIEATNTTIEISSDLPMINCNQEEFYRVFLNLFTNAMKYHSDRPPMIEITCQSEGMTSWRLQIKDNGIGIEAGYGYEERVFGLFQRLHQRDEFGGGTGIGLPICRKIINRHNGRIWVESEGLGKGTSVFITLPKI
jgi:PAS domain S-box-containing protein